MLKKKYRFRPSFKKSHFLFLNSSTVSIKVLKNNLDFSRFAFVVSKKVHTKAVVRNKTKRTLANCIEKMFLNIKEGHDMIFFAKPALLVLQEKDIYKHIRKQLDEKKLLK